MRFLSVIDGSVSLRRIRKRGMAIGVLGLTIEVNTQTGEVLRVRPMGRR